MTELTFAQGKDLIGRLTATHDYRGRLWSSCPPCESHLSLCAALKEKHTTITRLRRMIFGPPTEKASTIIPELKKMTKPRREAKRPREKWRRII